MASTENGSIARGADAVLGAAASATLPIRSAPGPGDPSSAPGPSSSAPSTSGAADDIMKSFDAKLPDIPCTDDSKMGPTKYFDISSDSGTSTGLAKPPIEWVEEDIDKFVDAYCKSELSNAQVSGKMPQLEHSHLLSNEADVVAASRLYLLHPVNLAAQAWLNKKKSGVTLLCSAESTVKETRSDVKWSIQTGSKLPNVNLSDGAIAILEYKRKHLIKIDNIVAAKTSAREEQAMIAKGRKLGGKEPTFLVPVKDSPRPTEARLVKQMVSYRTHNKVDDIVAFDWDTMFIMNFRGIRSEEPIKLPKGMVFQEQAKDNKSTATFRKLLLAFLIRALQDKLKLGEVKDFAGDGGPAGPSNPPADPKDEDNAPPGTSKPPPDSNDPKKDKPKATKPPPDPKAPKKGQKNAPA